MEKVYFNDVEAAKDQMDILKCKLKVCLYGIFKGFIFHVFTVISNVKEVIFTIFCTVQYLCNTYKVFQGFVFHEFGLYHEIL